MNQLYMKLFTMLATGTATNETIMGSLYDARYHAMITLPGMCFSRRLHLD
jgi:hypothetical protein